MLTTVFSILFLSCIDNADGVRASTWDYCECKFKEWQAWSDCDSTCFGDRRRMRQIEYMQHDGCDEFTDCASNDEGWHFDGCNEVCHNGGTRYGYFSRCNCAPGYSGSCCDDRISCGSPDSIANGRVSKPSNYYGATATYTCNQHYKLIDGNSRRTCGTYAWSGRKPKCAYMNHCASIPCKNGAKCTNIPDDYRCTCTTGWSGRHCENYIQPPVVSECLADQKVYATSHIKYLNWTKPTFVDPMQTPIQVTANYPSPEFKFPWGDFTVQYIATKPSNGLRTECSFQINMRPTPCKDLNIPFHGARLCNGWKTEYGKFCLVACQSRYTIDPSDYSYETFHVCGASGSWTPTGPLPDCEIHMSDISDIEAIQQSYAEFSYNSTCNDPEVRHALQELYIRKISEDNSFKEFCSNHAEDCTPDNVHVDCGGTNSGDSN